MLTSLDSYLIRDQILPHLDPLSQLALSHTCRQFRQLYQPDKERFLWDSKEYVIRHHFYHEIHKKKSHFKDNFINDPSNWITPTCTEVEILIHAIVGVKVYQHLDYFFLIKDLAKSTTEYQNFLLYIFNHAKLIFLNYYPTNHHFTIMSNIKGLNDLCQWIQDITEIKQVNPLSLNQERWFNLYRIFFFWINRCFSHHLEEYKNSIEKQHSGGCYQLNTIGLTNVVIGLRYGGLTTQSFLVSSSDLEKLLWDPQTLSLPI